MEKEFSTNLGFEGTPSKGSNSYDAQILKFAEKHFDAGISSEAVLLIQEQILLLERQRELERNVAINNMMIRNVTSLVEDIVSCHAPEILKSNLSEKKLLDFKMITPECFQGIQNYILTHLEYPESPPASPTRKSPTFPSGSPKNLPNSATSTAVLEQILNILPEPKVTLNRIHSPAQPTNPDLTKSLEDISQKNDLQLDNQTVVKLLESDSSLGDPEGDKVHGPETICLRNDEPLESELRTTPPYGERNDLDTESSCNYCGKGKQAENPKFRYKKRSKLPLHESTDNQIPNTDSERGLALSDLTLYESQNTKDKQHPDDSCARTTILRNLLKNRPHVENDFQIIKKPKCEDHE